MNSNYSVKCLVRCKSNNQLVIFFLSFTPRPGGSPVGLVALTHNIT